MTYSTFACILGLQILQSRDGIAWDIADAALPDTVPGYGHLDACPAGCGVWAPSIRYHKGRFYIYYGDPDIGIFCIRSEKTKTIPCRWEPAVLVKKGRGLIDPCPLWDNDGRCYLVHAFAGSRAGFKSALAICELAEDGLSVIREDQLVFDGHPDNPTCEGPKFHKRNGYYYIFCPAGGVKTGWQLFPSGCRRDHHAIISRPSRDHPRTTSVPRRENVGRTSAQTPRDTPGSPAISRKRFDNGSIMARKRFDNDR